MEKNIPQHVAIIPDGNRRWAKKRSLKPWDGHFKGAENTEELLRTALDLGVRCFSFWGGSLGNLTERPKMEIKFLCNVYERYFNKLLKSEDVSQNQVKIRVFGRWEEILPQKLIRLIKKVIERTEKYNERFLNVFLAYSGTDEMLEAVKGVIKESGKKGKIKMTADVLRKHLWTGDLPPVDFLIRTGSNNDPHNSAGFMMWNCSDSQLFFAKEYYPDFNKEEFIKAIKDYQKRERRLGK